MALPVLLRIPSTLRWRPGGLGKASVLLLAASLLQAELPDPRPVSPAGSRAEGARMAVDGPGNAFLAMAIDGKARVRLIGSGLAGEWILSDNRFPEAEPWIEVGPREVAWAV